MSEGVVTVMPAIESVFQVYTGRVGCMCGCLGSYKVHSIHRTFAAKHRGYSVDDDEVSDRSVKIVYNKIAKALEQGERVTTNSEPRGDTNYIYVQRGSRCLAFYFKI